jgi:two-component system, OmpR family, sensor kinase
MMVHNQSAGLVLLCTRQGLIQQVVRDDLGLTGPDTVGQPFVSLVDPGSAEKAANFLAALAQHGLAFDWEINVQLAARIVALHFVGGGADASWLIVGVPSYSDAMAYYDAMIRMHNEQANTLRVALQEVAFLGQRIQAECVRPLYEEFSRLNNDLANMQRELAKKNVELARLNEEKNRYLGIVAHDLRNPLGVILGYSQLLVEELSAVLTDEQQELLNVINSSVEFMQHLTNDLLDMAKIESGKLELHRQQTDLVALVQHNIVLNRIFASRKHIDLTFASDDDVPPLMLDRAKLDQVLNNLLSNAIKFSHPYTTVEVRVACVEGRVVISIKDQGQGIPADELDKLFKPFQRTSIASTAGESSTGLGLMIVHKIVTGHDGSIHVESEAGKGTIFYLSFALTGGRRQGSDEGVLRAEGRS